MFKNYYINRKIGSATNTSGRVRRGILKVIAEINIIGSVKKIIINHPKLNVLKLVLLISSEI